MSKATITSFLPISIIRSRHRAGWPSMKSTLLRTMRKWLSRVGGGGPGEAPAGEVDVPPLIAQQSAHRLELGRDDVLHRRPQIPDHRFREGGQRRGALAPVGGARLGQRRQELGLQLPAQVPLE